MNIKKPEIFTEKKTFIGYGDTTVEVTKWNNFDQIEVHITEKKFKNDRNTWFSLKEKELDAFKKFLTKKVR